MDCTSASRAIALASVWIVGLGSIGSACVQAPLNPPGVPGAAAPPAPSQTKKAGEEQAVAGAGVITVESKARSAEVRRLLENLLPKYPGVRSVEVEVEHGIVTLSGVVQDGDVRDQVTDFARRVEGVRLVLNKMQTDDRIMNGWQHAAKALGEAGDLVRRKWLLAIMAVAAFLAAAALGRKINEYSERLLAPFLDNALLRSVVGSMLGGMVLLGGVLIALSVLNLTHIVLSILGLAGLAGLAVGLAFRDIVENFIASVLLGVRRPFQIGDYIQVAGFAGVVKSLNSRATVLVTLEGNQVRIPNATVFKESVVNSSVAQSTRATFDVVVPYDVSTAAAQDAVDRALGGHDGILEEPAPRTLVESLEPDGLRLRAYFWTPSRGVDGFKVMSDAKLRAKVELQRSGIMPVSQSVWNLTPPDVRRTLEQPRTTDRPGGAAAITGPGNGLKRDIQAAKAATDRLDPNVGTPQEFVLEEASKTDRRDEGENLLKPDGAASSPAGEPAPADAQERAAASSQDSLKP